MGPGEQVGQPVADQPGGEGSEGVGERRQTSVAGLAEGGDAHDGPRQGGEGGGGADEQHDRDAHAAVEGGADVGRAGPPGGSGPGSGTASWRPARRTGRTAGGRTRRRTSRSRPRRPRRWPAPAPPPAARWPGPAGRPPTRPGGPSVRHGRVGQSTRGRRWKPLRTTASAGSVVKAITPSVVPAASTHFSGVVRSSDGVAPSRIHQNTT